MKLIGKIKKLIITIGTFFIILPTKVFAGNVIGTLYGISREPVKSNRMLDSVNIIWKISKVLLVPLVLIIGLVIYFKKSKSTTKKKVITMIIAVLLVIAICWGINYYINKYNTIY